MNDKVLHHSDAGSSRNSLPFALLLLGLAAAVLPVSGRADDFTVYSPHVVARQSEFELRGYHVSDGRSGFNGEAAAEFSVAHAFIGWWRPELYLARYGKEPGQRGRFLGYEFENVFQLTETGRYWADIGVLASYEHNIGHHGSDVVETGMLVEKTAGRFDHIVNLIWEKDVGAGAGRRYEFRYAYRGTYTVSGAFRPGIEAYGRPADRAYQAGPIVAGEWHVRGTATGSLEYRVGVVFGINSSAPRRTWLAQLEYEFF